MGGFELTEMANGLLGALLGSGFVGSIVLFWLRAKEARVAKLEDRLVTLEETRMVGVERRMSEIERGGCNIGSQVLGQLKTLIGLSGKLDGKLDRIAEATAGQAAEIQGNKSYLQNLDASLQRHKEVAHHG